MVTRLRGLSPFAAESSGRFPRRCSPLAEIQVVDHLIKNKANNTNPVPAYRN